MHAFRFTELDVVAHADNSGDLQGVSVQKNTYEVTGRGARNRQLVASKALLAVDKTKVYNLVTELVDALEKDHSVEVIGGPTTAIVTVWDLPPMTREQAASLIGKLAHALV
jgi:hypothetical protein